MDRLDQSICFFCSICLKTCQERKTDQYWEPSAWCTERLAYDENKPFLFCKMAVSSTVQHWHWQSVAASATSKPVDIWQGKGYRPPWYRRFKAREAWFGVEHKYQMLKFCTCCCLEHVPFCVHCFELVTTTRPVTVASTSTKLNSLPQRKSPINSCALGSRTLSDLQSSIYTRTAVAPIIHVTLSKQIIFAQPSISTSTIKHTHKHQYVFACILVGRAAGRWTNLNLIYYWRVAKACMTSVLAWIFAEV